MGTITHAAGREDSFRRLLAGFEFTRFSPHDPVPWLSKSMRRMPPILPAETAPLDLLNTCVKIATKLPVTHSLHQMPRMATIAISVVINELVASMPPGSAFVNVGVWNGYTFFSGLIGNENQICIGIDDFSEFGGPQHRFRQRFRQYRHPNCRFHAIDYRTYFAERHQGHIGLYLYDGAHDYQNQFDALQLGHRFIAPGGIILVDDTNWPEPRKATQDFLQQHRDQYRLVFDVETAENGHPTFWNGLMALLRL